MTTTSRRGVLRAAIAAGAVGAGGPAAADTVALRSESSHQDQEAAHLRGPAPLPYAQVIALDFIGGGTRAGGSLRTAHHVVEAVDGGNVAAWLAMQVGAGHGPGLNSPEPARDPGHDLVEHRPPTGRVYAVARSHRTIFRSPHNPR